MKIEQSKYIMEVYLFFTWGLNAKYVPYRKIAFYLYF